MAISLYSALWAQEYEPIYIAQKWFTKCSNDRVEFYKKLQSGLTSFGCLNQKL